MSRNNAITGLSFVEFQAMAAASAGKPSSDMQSNLARAALGVSTHSGRIAERVAHIAPRAHTCDVEMVRSLTEEIGATMGFLALAAEHLGTPLETCARVYVDGLRQLAPLPASAADAARPNLGNIDSERPQSAPTSTPAPNSASGYVPLPAAAAAPVAAPAPVPTAAPAGIPGLQPPQASAPGEQRQPSKVPRDAVDKARQLAADLAALQVANRQTAATTTAAASVPVITAAEPEPEWPDMPAGPMVRKSASVSAALPLIIGLLALIAIGLAIWFHPEAATRLWRSLQAALSKSR